MKIKIKVKEITKGCMPVINSKGDWIDLRAASSVSSSTNELTKLGFFKVPLGVAMKLPSGFEAIVAPRSSTAKNFGLMCLNSFGVIDETFSGNNDEWCFLGKEVKEVHIEKGDRICQFKIQLSQKATFWQKLKWLFSSGIELVKVNDLDSVNRGGFGSSGTK